MHFIFSLFINFILCKREERCPIYTFYADLSKSHDAFLHDSKIVGIWKRNWYKNGWTPIVIGREKAKSNPFYDVYMNRFSELPSVNPSEYEKSCYERWIAFHEMGGGILTDYDIVNLKADDLILSQCGKRNPLSSFKEYVPMFTIGGSTFISDILDYFASYRLTLSDSYNKLPHVSDMTLIRKNPSLFYKNILKSTPKSLVHFSHYDYSKLKSNDGFERVEWMQQSLLVYSRQFHRIIFIQIPNIKWKEYLSSILNVESCSPEWLPSQLNVHGKCKSLLFPDSSDFEKENDDIVFNFGSDKLSHDHIPLSAEDWSGSQLIIEYTLGTALNFSKEPKSEDDYYLDSRYYLGKNKKFNNLLSRIKKIEYDFY